MLVNGKKNLNGHSSNQRHQLPIIGSRDVDGQRVAVRSSGRIQEFRGLTIRPLWRSCSISSADPSTATCGRGAPVGVTDQVELPMIDAGLLNPEVLDTDGRLTTDARDLQNQQWLGSGWADG